MVNLIHRQVLQRWMRQKLKLGTEPGVRGLGATYGRLSHQLCTKRAHLSRTKAHHRTEQAATSAPAEAPACTASSSGSTAAAAGSTDGPQPGGQDADYAATTPSGPIPRASTNGHIFKTETTAGTTGLSEVSCSTSSSKATTSSSSDNDSSSSSNNHRKNVDDEDDEEGLSPLEIVTATSFIEKILSAFAAYGTAVLLSNFAGIEPTRELVWANGAPLGLGAAAAVPAVVGIGLLFAPSLDLGFTRTELRTVGKVDRDLDEQATTFSFGETNWPPLTPKALKQGLWLYQVHVLKPWYPNFQWSAVGALYLASCVAAGGQELLVRGYGGQLLAGWYTALLAGTTDIYNPIYWGKVFKLVTPETARWMAAVSLTVLQVALSTGAAARAGRFARGALAKTGRAAAQGGIQGVVVQDVKVTLQLGGEGSGSPGNVSVTEVTTAATATNVIAPQEGEAAAAGTGTAGTTSAGLPVVIELPTSEERVVYGSSLAVVALLAGSANCAWAAGGSLLASFTAQVVIDGAVTVLQQLKCSFLPEREMWVQVQKELEQEDDEDASDKAGK